jgi:DNA recombination protein RmuC
VRAVAAAKEQHRGAEAAGAIADQLLARANESFELRERLAEEKLAGQLKPVTDTLEKFQKQVTDMETARAQETGGLREQIGALLQASTAARDETQKLTAALRRGVGVQGRWGEQTLRNVLEMAGLQNRFDFLEQVTITSGERRQRPDVVVRMPGGGELVIDAKVSISAFLDAQDAPDEAQREAALARHADSVRNHIRTLASRAYQDELGGSADFVAMFIPGDSFLVAALDRQPDLLTEAMGQKVVVVTPTTLFALCKAVSYGWRVEDQARGAAEIARVARELYKRLSDMGGHVAGVGKALTQAVERYNQVVGSLESRVLPQARRFEALGVDHEGKPMPELPHIEAGVRPLARPEPSADDSAA